MLGVLGAVLGLVGRCHVLRRGEIMLRVSDQNGISQLYIIVEIYFSGWKPSICWIYDLCLSVLHVFLSGQMHP